MKSPFSKAVIPVLNQDQKKLTKYGKHSKMVDKTSSQELVKFSEANKDYINSMCRGVLAVPVVTDGNKLDEYVDYVKDISVIRLENPFERLLKQRIEAAVNTTVRPILHRLDVLGNKIAYYEENVLRLPGGQSETLKRYEALRRQLAKKVVEQDSIMDTCLVFPDDSLDRDYQNGKVLVKRDDTKQQMIVRVTSWRCKPVFIPGKFQYNMDLTRRRVDLLIEATKK